MPQLHTQALNFYAQFYEVRKKISELTAAYWSDLELYNWLNQGQLYIATKSKCLTKEVTVTSITDTATYDLKDNSFGDIINISEDGVYFNINGTSKTPLTYKTQARLNQEFPGWQGQSSSTPQYYYYNKSSKTIGLYPKPNSSNAGAYLFVNGYYKPKVLNAGVVSALSGTTLTLAVGSSTIPYPSVTNDYYNGLYIELYSGTGAGQTREITDYTGATGQCTVATWTTNPDTSTIYGMCPEIPEEAQYLMVLFAVAKAWEKTGTRTQLAQTYWQEFFSGLQAFIGETIEADDEMIIKDSYRS